jgi:signal transduction histidine kinase
MPLHRSRPEALDVGLAAGTFALFTLPVLIGGSGHGPVAAIAVLGAGVSVPLLVRRALPVPVLFCVTLVVVVAALLDVRFTPFGSNAGPALGIAVLTVADRLPSAASLRWCGAALALLTIVELAAVHLPRETTQNAVQLMIAMPAWFIGDVLSSRRRTEERLRVEEQKRAREAERRIRAEERLRVSADVHDIVSHTLSMIAVRSGVARMVLDRRPDEARVALASIETASRGALDELRAVLHSIRDPSTHPPTVERPSVADIGSLVEQLQRDGYPVTARLPDRVTAPPLTQESAYRVVQEALTNVVRHAGQVPVTVEVGCGPDGLDIAVVNGAGATGTGPGSGLGLAGMHDRVALHDGTVHAGPLADGGFAVRVHLPMQPADRASGRD